jgi:Tfp pilus assembly protein PilF
MKFAFFLLSSFLMALCFSGCSTAKSTQSQSQHFEVVTVSIAKEQYESGKLETAKENLLAVLRTDPNNQAAQYYLHLVEETQAARLENTSQPQGWHQTIPQQPVF